MPPAFAPEREPAILIVDDAPACVDTLRRMMVVPDQDDRLDAFLLAPDRAMNAAKDAGRKQVVAVHAGVASWQAVHLLARS